jgi:hypothetical protein
MEAPFDIGLDALVVIGGEGNESVIPSQGLLDLMSQH